MNIGAFKRNICSFYILTFCVWNRSQLKSSIGNMRFLKADIQKRATNCLTDCLRVEPVIYELSAVENNDQIYMRSKV